jgi:hypothetical protein
MAASLRLFFVSVLFGGGACARIIGVSDLELDPALDVAGRGGAGAAGSAGSGGRSGGTGAAGEAGEAGGASEPPAGCRDAAECDDEISCTKDDCSPSGECTHTADDTACTPADGKCTTCQLGIGCVDTDAVEQELLLDGAFDEQSGDWQDFSSVDVVEANEDAQSGALSVHFSAAPADDEETRFSNLSQLVHIPPGTVKLTASGWYQMRWAEEELKARPRSDEYVTLTLFSQDASEDGEYIRYLNFESWDATQRQQASWKSFSYDAPRSALNRVRDLDITLDLVGETWDTEYYFDTLSLKATICE